MSAALPHDGQKRAEPGTSLPQVGQIIIAAEYITERATANAIRLQSLVLRNARQNFRGVIRIAAAVPELESASCVSVRGGQFCGEDRAADFQSVRGIAELREGCADRAVWTVQLRRQRTLRIRR